MNSTEVGMNISALYKFYSKSKQRKNELNSTFYKVERDKLNKTYNDALLRDSSTRRSSKGKVFSPNSGQRQNSSIGGTGQHSRNNSRGAHGKPMATGGVVPPLSYQVARGSSNIQSHCTSQERSGHASKNHFRHY